MAGAKKFTGSNTTGYGVPDFLDRQSIKGLRKLNGVFNAKVVDFADERYQQHIWVELTGHDYFSDKKDIDKRHEYHKVRQCSPFGGTVHGLNYSNNYGAVFTPPAPGTEVIVCFTGQEQEGYLLGVLPDINRNAMLGGHPSSPDPDEGTVDTAFDHHVFEKHDGTRKKHPVGQSISRQGLALDALRGHGSSGARRESPSRLCGFNSPGGHSLVLDDGTEAYKEGINFVPDKTRKEGDNNLLRLRSGQGAQILLNDSAGIVYIINQDGTGWIEIDAKGNIDIYGESNISMHAKESINFYAGDQFNIDADEINLRARGSGGLKLEATTNQIQLCAHEDMKLTTKKVMHLKAGPHMKLTADLIDLNGPPATAATCPTVGALTVNREVKESINNRVPEHEPWGGHVAQYDQIAAQAKSDPVDPDTEDFSLSNQSGGRRGGFTGGTSARRSSQQDDEQVRSNFYPNDDPYGVGRYGEFDTRPDGVAQPNRDPYGVGKLGEFDTSPTGAGMLVTVPTDETVNTVTKRPAIIGGNPRTKREWKSDVCKPNNQKLIGKPAGTQYYDV